jgi:hypothetical protein
MTWDVFISHASEDKEDVARPLAELLGKHGVSVWLDQRELSLGDSLRRKIDEGLSQSRWGVVVLSPAFLEKGWPQAELDALLSREFGGEKVVLPVWHHVSAADVARRSALLASKLAVQTTSGLPAVTTAILRAIGRDTEATAAMPAVSSGTLLQYWASLDVAQTRAWTILEHLKEKRARGQSVGPYVLNSLLGVGGTGAVFDATHRSLGTNVALKLFFPAGTQGTLLLRSTERAIRGLGTLRNTSVASPLDFEYLRLEGATVAYLAFELIDGEQLDIWAKRISDSKPSLARRMSVAIQIAETLHAAHSCVFIGEAGFAETGILHGDIKPSNILIRRTGDVPVVIDFMIPDLQRLLGVRDAQSTPWERDENGNYRYQAFTASFGTPGYMPPEQAVDGIVTVRSDVYALGQTLHDLFGLVHTRSPPKWLNDDLLHLLRLMTDQRAERRPKSMRDVAKRLRRILSAEG